MRALITGGAGFVGRHLTKALLDRGFEIVCVDPIVPMTGGLGPENWPFFDPRKFSKFHFERVDCRAFFGQDRSKFDYAFHLAAMVGGRLMIDHEPLAVAEDLAIDAMFWRWAQIARPEHCVYFSSSAAYPISLQRRDRYQLLSEEIVNFGDNIGMPDMTYGWAKLTGEYLGRLAHSKFGLNVISYRPFSGFGEDQDLTYPFPAIARRVIEHKDSAEFIVWGSGQQMRDFIHIDDCVTCIISTMDRVNHGAAVNISTGKYTSFIELARMLLLLEGKTGNVHGMSDKPEGVFARGGARTLQEKLGFTPAITLEEGGRRMLAFQRMTLAAEKVDTTIS
jgi:nucleoside-diphosphate-sugar epimerase